VSTRSERKKADGFASDCTAVLGTQLVAVLLHGDAALDDALRAARGTLLETLLIVESVTVPTLDDVAGVWKRWKRSGLAAPLVLDRDYLATSCDVFPLEVLALMDTHLLVRGEADPLAGLVVDRANLRLEVEQQLKGKLLHLRQAYLEAVGSRRRIRALMIASSTGFEIIMRGLLLLADAERDAAHRITHEVDRLFGTRSETFRRVQAARRGVRLPLADVDAVFASYLDELGALARLVDGIPAQ
jgi:hypothetical protein